MSVDQVGFVPACVEAIQSQFAQFDVPVQGSAATQPTDPFSILLDAAMSPSAASTSPSSASDLSGLVSATDPSLDAASALSPTGESGPGTGSGTAIVDEAAKFLGVPYVWGGASPSGFDCSGLVQYVLGQLGVQVPHGSVAQSQLGTPVADMSQAEPGDLLFFEPGENGAPPGEPGHVGIYVGNGEMIDAPETGETVQVQPVPCAPLAIRRIEVPVTGPAEASSKSGSVEMGAVSVPDEYAGLIEQASAQSGTPSSLLAAVLYNESRFEPGVVSSAGAEGIAQFMPATAAANGVEPFAPSSAIPGAAELLASFHSAFGSWSDAVAAYAAGGGAVQAADGIPLDGTTPQYVARTLAEAEMAPGS